MPGLFVYSTAVTCSNPVPGDDAALIREVLAVSNSLDDAVVVW